MSKDKRAAWAASAQRTTEAEVPVVDDGVSKGGQGRTAEEVNQGGSPLNLIIGVIIIVAIVAMIAAISFNKFGS